MRRVAKEEESAMRTLERQTEHDRQRADYRDELERKRMVREVLSWSELADGGDIQVEHLNAQRKIADEERVKNEESVARQEQLRRRTLEHEAELRQKTELARVQAETEGEMAGILRARSHVVIR